MSRMTEINIQSNFKTKVIKNLLRLITLIPEGNLKCIGQGRNLGWYTTAKRFFLVALKLSLISPYEVRAASVLDCNFNY